MRITRIETFPVCIALKSERRMVSALGRHEVSRYVLVRISTDVGIEGVGEATVTPQWSGETVWGAKAIIDNVFAPLLIGCDPRDTAAIDARMDAAAQDNWFAKSAIEMACWDIHGKETGRPVFDLLGGAVRPLSIRCRFSMGAYSPERARQRAAELVAEGFQTMKVKVGTDPAADVERVRVVRKVIGPDRELVIDANGGYDAPTAIGVARQLEDCRITLFEQPTPRGDLAGMAEVRRSIGIPVMADELCFDLIDAIECLRNEACDVISVYPGKNGGIRKAQQIVEFAAGHSIACSIGSNLELDVASAAMCHLVAGCPNIQVERYPGDILGPEYHEASIARNPLSIAGPVISITDAPGLGIDVDWHAIERLAASSS
jgi:muconate cycloisomerase